MIFKGFCHVNLVGGENAASGNVYFMNGPVCDDNWDIEDGHVVCKELGYSSALEITRGSFFGPVYREFSTNNVACTGEEEGLQFCHKQDKTDTICTRKEAAGVVCKAEEEKSSHHRSRRESNTTRRDSNTTGKRFFT